MTESNQSAESPFNSFKLSNDGSAGSGAHVGGFGLSHGQLFTLSFKSLDDCIKNGFSFDKSKRPFDKSSCDGLLCSILLQNTSRTVLSGMNGSSILITFMYALNKISKLLALLHFIAESISIRRFNMI